MLVPVIHAQYFISIDIFILEQLMYSHYFFEFPIIYIYIIYIYIYIYIFVCVCVCVCVCDNVKRFSNVCLKSVKCSNTDGC